MKAENELKEKYLNVVCSLTLTELKKFDKFKYRDLMEVEINQVIEYTVSLDILKERCHYALNALNNECQGELGRRRRAGVTSPRKN